MDVELIRWPADADRREELAATGTLRLLLVDASSPAPVVVDVDEDWIRLPASAMDLDARTAALVERARRRSASVPALDDAGVLRSERTTVELRPIEARMFRALLDGFGTVVSRDDIADAGWPTGLPDRNHLDVHMGRLRRRIDAVGLTIRTVRSRGYMLERRPPEVSADVQVVDHGA